MMALLTRAETRRIAEIQISIKQIEFDIQVTSCAQEAIDLRTRRAEVEAELRSIMASASNRSFDRSIDEGGQPSPRH